MQPSLLLFGLLLLSTLSSANEATPPSRADVESWLKTAAAAQVSYVRLPTEKYPFADSMHFRYDVSARRASIAGPHYSDLRWSQRAVTDSEDEKIREALGALDLHAGGMAAPRASDLFRVAIATREGSHLLEWRGTYTEDGPTRTARVVRFLRALLANTSAAPIQLAPFDGEVRLSLDCDSLTSDGRIRLLARNGGTSPARLRPVFEKRSDGSVLSRIVAYWGYLPSAKGDALTTVELAAGKSESLLWTLDLATFKQSSARTQLLFAAEGLIEAGLPTEMTPLFLPIHRCDLPARLSSRAGAGIDLPAPFDESLPPADRRRIASLHGAWSFRERDRGATFHLIFERGASDEDLPGVLFLGVEDFGEHGLAYYAARPTRVAINAKGQLRIQLGSVEYYAREFTPERRVPRSKETPVGSGDAGLRFEGNWTGESLTLRCFSTLGRCPAPLFAFQRASK